MIKFKRGLSTTVASQNPILGEGQPFIESDTFGFKIGNGTDKYNDLPYINQNLGQNQVIMMTQSEYDSITPDENTIYMVIQEN